MMACSSKPPRAALLARSLASEACFSCHCVCTRSSCRSAYSRVRYLSEETASRISPAVSFLASSCLTCRIAKSSTAPISTTIPTEKSPAMLSRVEIFILASSMDDRHGLRFHGFQPIQIKVIQVIGNVGPGCEFVLDRPPRFILQSKQQALVQCDVELVGGPQLLQILEAHVDSAGDDLARRIWLILAESLGADQSPQELLDRLVMADHIFPRSRDVERKLIYSLAVKDRPVCAKLSSQRTQVRFPCRD